MCICHCQPDIYSLMSKRHLAHNQPKQGSNFPTPSSLSPPPLGFLSSPLAFIELLKPTHLGGMLHLFHFLTLQNIIKWCQSFLQIVFQIHSPCFIPTVINLVPAWDTSCWGDYNQLLAGLPLSTYTPCHPFSIQHLGGWRGLFKVYHCPT